MSGSGLLPAAVAPRRSAEAERADVLAYLARKRANAETMAKRSAEFEDEARWIVRQIDVLVGDINAGMHEGEAEIGEGRG